MHTFLCTSHGKNEIRVTFSVNSQFTRISLAKYYLHYRTSRQRERERDGWLTLSPPPLLFPPFFTLFLTSRFIRPLENQDTPSCSPHRQPHPPPRPPLPSCRTNGERKHWRYFPCGRRRELVSCGIDRFRVSCRMRHTGWRAHPLPSPLSRLPGLVTGWLSSAARSFYVDISSTHDRRLAVYSPARSTWYNL